MASELPGGCHAGVRLLLLAVVGCAGHARSPCPPVALSERPHLAPPGIDLFAGAAIDPVEPPAPAPSAPMRVGHGAGRELLAELRQAVGRGDCQFAAQIADRMPVEDADHEYARYALAWCRYDHGDRGAAYAGLAELARLGSDPGLRGFVVNDLIAMLAATAPVEDAIVVLRDARLAQPSYLDRYLAALVAARREQGAAALWRRTELATPLADETSCRRTVADCRRDLASGRWQIAYWTCHAPDRPRISPACRATLGLARAQVLIDWDGTRGPEAEVGAAVRALRDQRIAAGHADDLDLVLLALDWDLDRRDPDHWRTLAAAAGALQDRARSPHVRSTAAALARVAGDNERRLRSPAGCTR